MLATQDPAHWPTQGPQAFLSLRKLFYRARLEAELQNLEAGHQEQASRRRVGRLSDAVFSSYGAFRAKALDKMGLGSAAAQTPAPVLQPGSDVSENAREKRLFFRFCCLWTLRSLLGPVIESYILLDRHLYLLKRHQQNYQLGETASLLPVFDQASGSLRNMAFVVCQRGPVPEEAAPLLS